MSARRNTAAALAALVALGASGAVALAPAASAPEVQAMVVGIGGNVLAGDRWVAAAATTVTASGRTCAVAAGTPLAVLAAVQRAGGPGFATRDYGHCGANPSRSGQLFVYSVGGESNRGQSGWEYKVDGVAGSTGAADTSGPSGDGRLLRAGERVLWFWCEARGGGCERTLTVSPARAYAAHGGRLIVTVTGQDNEGRAVPVAGATVYLGSHRAVTDAHGHATVVVPSARGGYWLSAARRGLVPAFPGWIVAR